MATLFTLIGKKIKDICHTEYGLQILSCHLFCNVYLSNFRTMTTLSHIDQQKIKSHIPHRFCDNANPIYHVLFCNAT
jgi:hypothetical protein